MTREGTQEAELDQSGKEKEVKRLGGTLIARLQGWVGNVCYGAARGYVCPCGPLVLQVDVDGGGRLCLPRVCMLYVLVGVVEWGLCISIH